MITEQELETVISDLKDKVNQAADKLFAYYAPLEELAVQERAKILGISEKEFRGWLDEKHPAGDATYREINSLPPKIRRSDFVLRELHLGYNPKIPGVLGVTWLNTGIVYYNPQARIRDYLMMNQPTVLMHEMIHASSILQKFPMSEAFEVETFAEFPEILYPEDQIDFFFHPYAATLRELAWIYFGFNFKQARKEIIKFDLGGNLMIDETAYRRNFAQLEKIKEELMRFYPKVIRAFYSDPIWWSAMNERRSDKEACLRILMAQNYDMTILGGREATMKWLATNESKILRAAKIAWDKTADKEERNSLVQMRLPQFIIDKFKRLFTSEEQAMIEKYFREHPLTKEELENLSLPQLWDMLRKFKTVEKGGVR